MNTPVNPNVQSCVSSFQPPTSNERVPSLILRKACKVLAFVVVSSATLHSQPLAAQEMQETNGDPSERRIGIGLMVGEPTGINAKFWLSESSAIDAMIGLSLDQDDDFTTHADYLYHFHDVFEVDSGRFSLYLGGGPRYVAREHRDDLFGLRTVAGLAYDFEDIPLDVFLEGGPVFDLAPDVEVRYTLAAGVRFWF